MDRSTRPRYRVPDELRESLLDFTIAYLLERPTNVAEFGLDFFLRLRSGRRGDAGSGGTGSNQQGRNMTGTQETFTRDENQNPSSLDARTSDAEMQKVDVTSPSQKRTEDGRRKSVFTEEYNPEEDDNDEKPVHPKSDAQREMLYGVAKHILLFRTLENDQLKDVIDAMFNKSVQAGDIIIKQGEDGDNFYVVEKGKFKAISEPDSKVLATYDDSGSFGELALMYNMPRAATIQAETDGSLWALDRHTFRRIILRNAYKKRKMYSNFIKTLPMLESLNDYERMNLADALIPKTFTDGTMIINEGETADGMYFVEEGQAKVWKQDGENMVEVNTISAGGYFGELALLTSKPRAATVTAVGDIKVAFLDVEAFERLLGPCMDVMKRNAANYEQQLVRIFGSASQITDMRSEQN